MEKGGNEVVIN